MRQAMYPFSVRPILLFSLGLLLLLGGWCGFETAEASATPSLPPRLEQGSRVVATVARRKRRRRKRRRRRSRKMTAGETLELNSATRRELMRLPRVGGRTADRILSYRRSIGKFRSLQQLRNVHGIGPQTLRRLRPFLVISGQSQKGRPISANPRSRRRWRRRKRARSVYITSHNGRLVMRVQGGKKGSRGNCYQRWLRHPRLKKHQRVNVNTAGVAGLRKLPCIGKKRARAIISMRKADGAFRKLKDLEKINGISRRTAAWLKKYVRFRVDLNTATLEQLESFPVLSNGLGEAILSYRKQRGGFRKVRDLLRIRGVGRATFHRIQNLFVVSASTLPVLARQKRRYRRRTSSRAVKRRRWKRKRRRRGRRNLRKKRPRSRKIRRKGLPELEVTDID